MSDEKPDVLPGDWVRFYSGGKLILGIVQYVERPRSYPWEWEASTDVGVIRCADIKELRREGRAQP